MQRQVTIVNPRILTARQFRGVLAATEAARMNDERAVAELYVSAPAIATRGTWKIVEIISDESLAMLAIFYTHLTKGKGWQ